MVFKEIDKFKRMWNDCVWAVINIRFVHFFCGIIYFIIIFCKASSGEEVL